MRKSAGDGSPKPLSKAKKRRAVIVRAAGHCEYCRLVEEGQLGPFHLEHVVPTSLGGPDELDNLAWACPACNLSKSDRVEVLDPLTGEAVAIFSPRQMNWRDHFGWSGYQLIGRTPIGRALIHFLDLNSAKRLAVRGNEDLLGYFVGSDDPPV